MNETADTIKINIEVNSKDAKNEIKSIESELSKMGNILKSTVNTNSVTSSSFDSLTSKTRKFYSTIKSIVNISAKLFNEV